MDLLTAVSSGDEALVRKILDGGVSDWTKDYNGNTALHLACAKREFLITSLIISAKADPNARNIVNETPMISLCTTNQMDTDESDLIAAKIVPLLAAAGCSLDSQDVTGSTALIAASHSKVRTIEALIRQNANLELRCDSDDTALTVAIQWGNTKAATLLIKAGANLSTEDQNGWYPLTYAIRERNHDLIKVLLEQGDNVDKPTRKFGSHRDFARQHGIDLDHI